MKLLHDYIRLTIRESRFKQMSKSKFTDLKNHLANSSFLTADPAGDGDVDDWSSEASEALRDNLNDYFDLKFEPGYLTGIVKVSLMPEETASMTKEDVLKGAAYKFEDGLHFIEVILASVDDGETINAIPKAHEKVYEVLMHELLHMQQFLKFSKGKPTDKKWNQFMKSYKDLGGPSGMGEDYFFFDEADGASELETFSFQIANELFNSLGRNKAVSILQKQHPDHDIIRLNSSSFRDIESRSNINRPEFREMLKRAKQYIKRMKQ